MELIEIIFDVLTYGGSLLVIVVIISYAMSRTNHKENPEISLIKKVEPLFLNTGKLNSEQAKLRNDSIKHVPVIYLVDTRKNRDLKIVRKPTVHDRESQENFRQKENPPIRKTKTNGSRYTIVNEELAKSQKPRVINFYL
jgi:pyruvate-formate lyase